MFVKNMELDARDGSCFCNVYRLYYYKEEVLNVSYISDKLFFNTDLRYL